MSRDIAALVSSVHRCLDSLTRVMQGALDLPLSAGISERLLDGYAYHCARVMWFVHVLNLSIDELPYSITDSIENINSMVDRLNTKYSSFREFKFKWYKLEDFDNNPLLSHEGIVYYQTFRFDDDGDEVFKPLTPEELARSGMSIEYTESIDIVVPDDHPSASTGGGDAPAYAAEGGGAAGPDAHFGHHDVKPTGESSCCGGACVVM